MTVQVKICGMTRPEDVEAAIRYGAHFIGAIVGAKSKREVSLQQAGRLFGPARGLVRRVAVTVNPSDAFLDDLMEQAAPGFIQLHGFESPERCTNIRARTGAGIIKAIKVGNLADLSRVGEYAGVAEYILLDAPPPEGVDQQGGHGTALDWDLLRGYKPPRPCFLAGGLTPANVARAIKLTDAKFVDVASGVEGAPGIKDPSLIQSFIENAHNA